MTKIDSKIFPMSFIFFLISGYLIHPTPTWAIIFYAITIPLTTYIFITEKQKIFELFKNKIFITSISLIIWFLLTILWGRNQPDFNINKYILRSITNLIFIFSSTYFFSNKREYWSELLFTIIPYAIILNIFLSITIFYGINGNSLTERLTGWAETRHPILGSLVILTGFCITLYQSQISTNKKQKTIYAITCFACVLFVALTQSRGPILTLLCICIVFSVFFGKVVRYCMAGTLLVIILVLVSNEEIQRQVLETLSRNSWRLEIWGDAWKYILDAPIIGNGLASINTFGSIEQRFPHSIYVSAAFFGGAIGLFLLLALFAQLAWAALITEDKNKKAFHIALLCVPVIGGLTDLAQVSKSPGELWYILWVPVTIIIGHSIKSHRERKPQVQQVTE